MWSSHGRDDTPGVVERKLTSDTTAAGRHVKASPEADRPPAVVWLVRRRVGALARSG